MSNGRPPGSIVHEIDGVTWRTCKDCARTLEQNLTNYCLQNKSISRQQGTDRRPTWDCRCRECSRKHNAKRRAAPKAPPSNPWLDRGPARTKLPAMPPPLTWATVLGEDWAGTVALDLAEQ